MADMTARAGFPPDDYISQLEAELTEARAQIAAKDAAMAHLATVTLENLAGLRAQIAAKDAVLRWLDQRGGLGFDAHDRIRAVLETK